MVCRSHEFHEFLRAQANVSILLGETERDTCRWKGSGGSYPTNHQFPELLLLLYIIMVLRYLDIPSVYLTLVYTVALYAMPNYHIIIYIGILIGTTIIKTMVERYRLSLGFFFSPL